MLLFQDRFRLLLWSLSAMLLLMLATGSQRVVAQGVFSNAVVEAKDQQVRLTGVLGQPFAGAFAGPEQQVALGFWASVSPPEISTTTERPDAVPHRFRLDQNYPNPFNPATTIRYALNQASPVRLVVYDVLGREVAVLVQQPQPAGIHEVVFEAGGLPSGIYLYHLSAGARREVRRMLLLK